ncbi:LADA_0C04676g1_1 [Lachancea dasiensis]|uniref:Pre-mRNA-splicing factor CWC24 n=1 Tax=Lachancea dasiensis TaxID=1072105 RepID=A0A1G4IZ50_9SACH|nr:LADA_0C04676g1_1 [Lachancea dasiensis]
MFKKRRIKGGTTASKRQKIVQTKSEVLQLPSLEKYGLNGNKSDSAVDETSLEPSLDHNSDDEKGFSGDTDTNTKSTLGHNSDLAAIGVELLDDKPATSISNDLNPTKNSHSDMKTTLYMDYQPDVCKDFKQTGFCGYGDSCKFLHIRDDFKTGWKLNQEWKVDLSREDIKQLEDVPFKCLICKQDYKFPVVTNCGHYFCSACFMNRAKKTTKCYVCSEDTHGVARSAKNLASILKKQPT